MITIIKSVMFYGLLAVLGFVVYKAVKDFIDKKDIKEEQRDVQEERRDTIKAN